MPAGRHELVYDWNQGGLIDLKGVVHVELNDETLRDGLQGPLSGESNVQYWLEHHGYPTGKDLVAKIFRYAKHSDRILTDGEIKDLVYKR